VEDTKRQRNKHINDTVAELNKATPDSRGIQAGPRTTEPQPNIFYTVNRAGRNRIVFSPQTIQQIQRKNRGDCRAKQPSNNNNPKGANRVKPKPSNFPGSRGRTVVRR